MAIPGAFSRPSGIPFFHNRALASRGIVAPSGNLALFSVLAEEPSSLFRSVTLGEKSFSELTDGPQASWLSSGFALDATGQVILVGGDGEGAVVNLSTDGGDTWLEQIALGAAVVGWKVSVSADGQSLCAADQTTSVWFSTDGGATWVLSATPPMPGAVNLILASKSSPEVVVLFTEDNYYITDSAGVAWSYAGQIRGTIRAAASDLSCIYNYDAESGILHYSTDLGQSWEFSAVEIGATLVCSSSGERLLMFSPELGARISEDRGLTWDVFPLANGMGGAQVLAGCSLLQNVLATDDRGLLYLTRNSGSTWTNLVLDNGP